MRVPRGTGTATLLHNGTVLMAGGPSNNATTELYNPGFETPRPITLRVTPNQARMRVG